MLRFRYFCPILTKLEFKNTKFQGNPFRGSRADMFGRTEGRTNRDGTEEGNRGLLQPWEGD